MTTIQLYYRYFSDDGPYYFDPKDNSTTFQLPIDGIILDPYTLQPVEIDPSLNPEYGLLVDAYNSFVFEQQQAEMREQSKGTKVEVVYKDPNEEDDNIIDYRVKDDDTVVTVEPDSLEVKAEEIKKDKIEDEPIRIQKVNSDNEFKLAPTNVDVAHLKRSKTLKHGNKKHKRERAHSRINEKILDIPDEVNNFDENKISKDNLKRVKSFVPNEKAPYLPNDIKVDIHKFQVLDYAKQYFREHRKGKVFSRKLISLEQITQFSKEPLEFSLIKLSSQTDEKNAVKCFKLILHHTGVIPSKGNTYADQIVQILNNNPSLYDEVFFQLIKQTRQNPCKEWEIKTWELFLIIATIILGSLGKLMNFFMLCLIAVVLILALPGVLTMTPAGDFVVNFLNERKNKTQKIGEEPKKEEKKE